MTSEDLFRLFEANANGMEEFARLSGEVSQRRRLSRGGQGVPSNVVPTPVAAIKVEEELPRRSWLERVGLVAVQRKPRRRLTAAPQGLVSSQTS